MIRIINLVKSLLSIGVGALAFIIIFHSDAPISLLKIFVGLVGLLVVFNSNTLESIKFIDSIRRDFKLVEVQNFIASEIKKNNTQVINLITSQADLLSKMTAVAMKKDPSYAQQHSWGESMVQTDSGIEVLSKSKE